ncbi:CRTAC1 family protein [Acidobacteria bacterium AH-259-G07]|nr:CRTAC1 family protein [Acidobacteria bacterium AH-259-G07]
MRIFKRALFFLSSSFIFFFVLAELGRSIARNQAGVQFLDVTQASAIDFIHIRAATPEKYLVEIMGSGCAFFDYNGDGWLDIFLVNGGKVPGFHYDGEINHALYRNRGNGKFQDVSRQAGIQENLYYGMGVTVGDYNNDGYDDLYLTYFRGPNQLYRNNGDGTFTDVTRKAGLGGGGRWSTSAAFFDYNRDAFLDLYVCRYADFDFDDNRVCGPVERGFRIYCSPKIYEGIPDLLFRNNKDGTFTDVSSDTGISSFAAKGLGVVGADLNQDGWPDIYIANDTDPNYLFRNNGDETFQEIGLLAGVALGENGEAQSGMGIGCADYDGDGLFDLAVTNLDSPEYLAVYRNLGNFFFEDVSSRINVKRASSQYVGFGVGFFDFDNDADLDLFAANGHIDDRVHLITPGRSFQQPKLLFENIGPRFEEVSLGHGEALLKKQVSRGAAFADYDNDGDVDILVANAGEKPMLLRNNGGNRQNWLSIRLRGVKSNRNGIGAVLTLQTGTGIQKTQIVGGGSYLSSNHLRVHFGLGAQQKVTKLQVHWPSGIVDQMGPIDSNQFILVTEGETIVPQNKKEAPEAEESNEPVETVNRGL